jgi:hypothetical protein
VLIIIIHCIRKKSIFSKKEKIESSKYSSVVILGCARDVEKYLTKVLKSIERISSLFEKSKVIIYENDSIDKTVELLQTWGKGDIISEKNIPGKRTHRLAYARNKLLDLALKENSEYIIILDLDDRCEDISIPGIVSTLDNTTEWAMMGANQKDKYYDVWALRTFDNWMRGDFLSRENCGENDCHVDNIHIPQHMHLIQVKSCFGGLGIYKTRYIKNCKYYGGEGDKEVCEHVSLNECINSNKGKLFINPKMINS